MARTEEKLGVTYIGRVENGVSGLLAQGMLISLMHKE